MGFAQHLVELPVLSLFLIVGVGLSIGSIRVRGYSLGAAGVLFTALFFGHVTHRSLPRPLTDVGLLLFVYAVALQAGPRCFGILRARGRDFVLAGLAATAVGAAVTVAISVVLHLSAPLAAGLFAGATTCTPALAAATDIVGAVMNGSQNVASVGYGVAYPFAVFSVVMLVQALPALLRTPVSAAADQARIDDASLVEAIEVRTLRVTNPYCAEHTLEELRVLQIARGVFSRVRHGDIVGPARPETRLAIGDLVRAVGLPDELAKLEALLGERADPSQLDVEGDVVADDIVASHPEALYRTLRDLGVWERIGVVVTRVRREGIEFVPSGSLQIEPGDVLRVVGARADVEEFLERVGQQEKRLDETALGPFALGIALGALVGSVPVPLPGGYTTRLGMAGGAFIVGLLLSHIGHASPVRLYVPAAARLLARELGLVIFLATAGSGAGVEIGAVLAKTGPVLLAAGMAVTAATVGTALLVMRRASRLNVLTIAGALGGTMTSSPALNAATGIVDSEAQAIGFASMYPIALIAKILLVQAVFVAVRRLSHGP